MIWSVRLLSDAANLSINKSCLKSSLLIKAKHFFLLLPNLPLELQGCGQWGLCYRRSGRTSQSLWTPHQIQNMSPQQASAEGEREKTVRPVLKQNPNVNTHVVAQAAEYTTFIWNTSHLILDCGIIRQVSINYFHPCFLSQIAFKTRNCHPVLNQGKCKWHHGRSSLSMFVYFLVAIKFSKPHGATYRHVYKSSPGNQRSRGRLEHRGKWMQRSRG